jgi:prolyl 4-hydroxylase
MLTLAMLLLLCQGNVYTNHWSAPSKILNLANDSLVGAAQLRRRLVEQVGSILEAWTGQPLTPTSLYGIRIYQDGAILVRFSYMRAHKK